MWLFKGFGIDEWVRQAVDLASPEVGVCRNC